MNIYQNICHMTRPVPSHLRMPRKNRAKIFAPYQALKGFGGAIHVKNIIYVYRLELSEYVQERLDQKLRRLRRWDTVTLTWFRPKLGENDRGIGQYITATGMVERFDPVLRVLLFGGQRIAIEDIAELRGKRLDEISEWEITGFDTPDEDPTERSKGKDPER